MVAPTNRMCAAANAYAVAAYRSAAPVDQVWRERGCLRIDGVITGLDHPVSAHALAQARGVLRDMRFRRASDERLAMDVQLDLVLGGPVIVNMNLDVSSGVANGSLATVEDIVLRPGVVPVMDTVALTHTVSVSQVAGLVCSASLRRPAVQRVCCWRSCCVHLAPADALVRGCSPPAGASLCHVRAGT
jgi:hypothetical protein